MRLRFRLFKRAITARQHQRIIEIEWEPERFAMEALGHNSHAVHRAYVKGAQVKLPALEEYEKSASRGKVIPMAQEKYAL